MKLPKRLPVISITTAATKKKAVRKNMLKKVSVICLFLCSVPFSAWADTITEYTINFTTTSGVAPPSGSFTYDSTVQSFANFLVSWGGITFDLTAAADSPILFGTGCTGEAATPAYGFAIMSQDVTGCPVTSYILGHDRHAGIRICDHVPGCDRLSCNLLRLGWRPYADRRHFIFPGDH